MKVSLNKTGPCVGVTAADLDYSTINEYGSGKKLVRETAKDHIMRNHIDPPYGPSFIGPVANNKSRYETDPPQDRDSMFTQVQVYNALTFSLGAQVTYFNKRGDIAGIAFVFTFPPIAPHPSYPPEAGIGAGWIGTTGSGKKTLTNTLTLKPDCKTVTNSFPGTPF